MSKLEDDARPLGERTPQQRRLTYGLLALFALVCTALWWSNAVEGGTGPARLGDFIFPLVTVFFVARLAIEVRSTSSSR